MVAAGVLGSVVAFLAVAGAPRSTAAQTHQLVLSASSRRTSPVPLDGATVTGPAYIFVAPGAGVVRARFHLGGAGPAGAAVWDDYAAPFDLGGTAPDGVAAAPFDVVPLGTGDHTVSAELVLDDGSTMEVSARMRVVVTEPSAAVGATVPRGSAAPGTADPRPHRGGIAAAVTRSGPATSGRPTTTTTRAAVTTRSLAQGWIRNQL